MGYVLFLALESVDFCNNYLRYQPATTGLVTLSGNTISISSIELFNHFENPDLGFMYFWGWVFVFTTTAVALLKHEKPELNLDQAELNVRKSYEILWNIINLRNVKALALFTLTSKVSFKKACYIFINFILKTLAFFEDWVRSC